MHLLVAVPVGLLLLLLLLLLPKLVVSAGAARGSCMQLVSARMKQWQPGTHQASQQKR
jgi:hypothetical protein